MPAPDGHLIGNVSAATLQVYLDDDLVYRNDGDRYRLPPGPPRRSGVGPYFITGAGRPRDPERRPAGRRRLADQRLPGPAQPRRVPGCRRNPHHQRRRRPHRPQHRPTSPPLAAHRHPHDFAHPV
ncbi:hypothetical protein ACR6C2_36530 [Streptomyces sp. INA 01156]